MKLIPKTHDFNQGKKIFVFPNGEFQVSDEVQLPTNAVIGAEIPDQEGRYILMSTLGTFIIRVHSNGQVEVSQTFLRDAENIHLLSYLNETDVLSGVDYPRLRSSVIAKSQDGGYATIGFLDAENIQLDKTGSDGTVSRVIAISSLEPITIPTATPQSNRISALLVDESGWYFHLVHNGSGSNKFAYLVYIDFEEPAEDKHIYVGRDSTISDLNTSGYNAGFLDHHLTFSSQGDDIVMLWYGGAADERLIKFTKELEFVAYSPNLTSYDHPVSQEPMNFFNNTLVRVGDKYYVDATEYTEVDGYDWETFLYEIDEDLNILGFTIAFRVLPGLGFAQGYHSVSAMTHDEENIYVTGIMWDNPALGTWDLGLFLASIDPETMEQNWQILDYGTDEHLEPYYISELLDTVYVSAYTEDTAYNSVDDDTLFMYRKDDGSFVGSFFENSDISVIANRNSLKE